LKVIEFISIVVLTFALALVVLGAVTMWLDRGRGRLQGIALALVGLLVGAGYAFLGSRLALRYFGRLIVLVDLPALMATAFTYTTGVLAGVALAVGLFLWASPPDFPRYLCPLHPRQLVWFTHRLQPQRQSA